MRGPHGADSGGKTMRASLTRAVAATAAAVAVMLSVAGAASATTKPAKTPTTLSITEARTTISPGEKDAIGGVLLTGTKPVAQKVVYLYYYNSSARKWLPVDVDLTSNAGKVAFTVKPKTATDYQLVFKGTKTLYSAGSGVAVGTVTS